LFERVSSVTSSNPGDAENTAFFMSSRVHAIEDLLLGYVIGHEHSSCKHGADLQKSTSQRWQ
jgi:hypothetical protein